MEVLQKECIIEGENNLGPRQQRLNGFFGKWCDFWNFVYIMLRSKIYHLLDFLYVFARCYPKSYWFTKIDVALLMDYWLESPFAISKRYLQLKFEPDIYQYGETPLSTMEQIAQKLAINENDHIFELGSGTGRCAFWLACFRRCRVTGIEQIPQFIDCTQRILDHYKPLKQRINFIQGNFLTEDLSAATIIYLYGSKMNSQEIESLILNLRGISPETRIVTVSYSLNEIIRESKNENILKENFTIVTSFRAEFFWGKSTVFIQKASLT
jgi:precorrin-6B methylase 2